MKRQPWFRMFHEARTDRKLALLSDAQFRVWFNLLCFAADAEDCDRGEFDASDAELLAIEVASGDTELLLETLARLVRLRILHACEDSCLYTFISFQKRQYDKESDKPEATRERKQLSRERQKTTRDSTSAPSPDCHNRVTDNSVTPLSRDVTRSHAQEEKRREENISPQTPLEEVAFVADATVSDFESPPVPEKSTKHDPESGAKALLVAFRTVRHPTAPEKLPESEWSVHKAKAKALLADGVTPDQVQKATGAMMRRWQTAAMCTFPSLVKNWTALNEPDPPSSGGSRASPGTAPPPEKPTNYRPFTEQ